MFLGGMAEITANPVPQSVAEPTPLATPIVLKPEPPRHSKRYRWAHDVPVSLGTTLDGLILARVIDQGAFGTIYEALDMANVKTFAVKVEKSISKPKFLMTEAKVYRRLQAKPDLTAHICPMYRWCKRDTIHYLVLAYLGKNLELLKLDTEDQRFSPGTVAEIGQQCLQAIKATHTVGYVHRDIKPTNFAIGRQLVQMNQIFLLDFGLAKSYRHRDGRLRSPRFLASDAGTARYWSIRAHSGGEVGRSDDLWSLFYMLVGC